MRMRQGFTLVELLVVIAVLSVLAALLLPTLQEAQYSARLLVCANQMRQTGFSVMQYTEDYRGRYPYRRVAFEGNSHHQKLISDSGVDDRPMLRPYLDLNLLHCPLAPAWPKAWGSLDNPAITAHLFSSYEMWFGSFIAPAVESSYMLRVGDRPKYNGNTFDILLSDFDWYLQSWNYYGSSHRDRSGLASENFFTYGAFWSNTSDFSVSRGEIDRNFLRDDCSAFTITGIMLGNAGTELKDIPNYGGGAFRAYLPAVK